MVECSPATRAARVRFPADAHIFISFLIRIATSVTKISDGGNGNHSASLPIILIKIAVDQML